MKVLTIKSREWFLNEDHSQLHGYGDPFSEHNQRDGRLAGPLLVVDLRELPEHEQGMVVLRLPVVDTRLAAGMVWSHGTGRHTYHGTHDWLGGAAPDVYARIAEEMGATVTYPQEATA